MTLSLIVDIYVYKYNGVETTAKGEGNGPIDACKNALNERLC